MSQSEERVTSTEVFLSLHGVSLWPAFLHQAWNPYTSLLSRWLLLRGVQVEEWSPWAIFSRGQRLWHFHWPESCTVTNSAWVAAAKASGLIVLCFLAKLRGIKVVWTVHNLGTHDRPHPAIEALLLRVFVLLIDGYICLTRHSNSVVCRRWPALRTKTFAFIPHGHYRQVYGAPPDKQTARRILKLRADAAIVSFVGALRPYKNVHRLVEVVSQLTDQGHNVQLVIAGYPDDPAYTQAITNACSETDCAKLVARYIDPREMGLYFGAADVAVLPFSEVLNSGSAMLSLSFNTPVLLPATGSFLELQQELGPNWVHVYSGELSADVLLHTLAGCAKRPDAEAPLSQYEWPSIASKTKEFYLRVLGDGADHE